MLIIDAFFRFSGIGLMLFLCILSIRDIKNSPSLIYFVLVFLSITCHFLGFTPTELNLPYFLRMIFRFLDVPFLVFIWLFSLSMFKKDFKFTTFHLLIGFVYSFFIFTERLVQFRFIDGLPIWWAWVVNLYSLAFILHLLFVAITGRNDDLIETRRKSRVHLVYITAFISVLLISISFLLLKYTQYNYIQPTTNIIAIWPIIIWFGFWLFNINENSFSFDSVKTTSYKTLNSRDKALQKKLDFEVIENKAFLENGLSIQMLAQKLGVSSYRLREFINQTLGYDNFSTFINAFRIESIKNTFSNPDKNHIPILTIALDNGFNSLPTFNRTFKVSQGITPSEFRRNIKNSQN